MAFEAYIFVIVAALLALGAYFIYNRLYKSGKNTNNDRNSIRRLPPTSNHQTINMPQAPASTPYHGQEYFIYPNIRRYDEPPTTRPPEDEVAFPPPTYNEHKKDVRLPPPESQS